MELVDTDETPAAALAPVEIVVCATCRSGVPGVEGEDRPGAKLIKALQEADLPAGVRVRRAECLSNCSRGCSIALRGEGRWTYVYGDLDAAEHVADVVEGAVRYWRSADGLVPWRLRPVHFRKHCIARVPPLEIADV